MLICVEYVAIVFSFLNEVFGQISCNNLYLLRSDMIAGLLELLGLVLSTTADVDN